MTDGNLSRRKLLARSLQIPLGGMLLATTATVQTAHAAAKACVDLSKIPDDQKVMRESMKYVKKGKDAAKSCGNCVFFKPTSGGCGTCQLFSDGPAEVSGSCDGWAAKG